MSNTELTGFFSLVSKEKNKNETRLKTQIENPKSDLGNLLKELENALKETKKVSEEPAEEKIFSEEDQNKLEVFSNLVNLFDSTKEIEEAIELSEIPETIIPVDIFNNKAQKYEEEKYEDSEPPIEDIPEEFIKTDNIIQEIVSTLDDMGKKTEVKEEIDQISALRRDFVNFKNIIQRDISNQKMSGAGSGEVRLEFLDDIQRSTAKVDGKVLQYSSSDGKWIGATALTGALTDLDIDGGTDIGAALADADLFIVDDGAGGTNRKIAASGIKTYVSDVTLTTAAQSNITSVGTLTSLTVDNIVINGTNIGHTSDTDALAIDSSGNVTASQNLTVSGNFTVSGTTTTVNAVTVNVEDAFVFEGATSDAFETIFSVSDPTADRTIVLPDANGQVQVTPPLTLNGTDGSSTDAGDRLVQNTAANDGDQILYEDATSDVIAVFASHGITLSGLGWNAFQLDNG